MSISIKNIRSATASEWDHIWKECDYSTYFHSREWAEIWNRYTKGKMRPDPKLIMFTDGKKAILPLSYRKTLKGLVKSYISSPAGTFGGWISTDELTVEHGKLLTNYLVDKHKNLFWRLNPYDRLAARNGIKITENDETHALNLSDDFETIYEKWSKGGWKKGNLAPSRTAYMVRKARKYGVSVRPATTLDDWREYYQVYEDSLDRWGDRATSHYRWELFNEIYQRNSPYTRLWLGVYDSRIIVGGLCFYAKRHAVTWHGATLKDYFKLHPMRMLVCEMVKDACDRGYAWFDFNPSGGHEGVKAFKKSFGAQALPSPVVHIKSLPKFIRHFIVNCWVVLSLQQNKL